MHERGQGRRAERHTGDEKMKSSNLLIKFAELSVGVRVNASVKFTLYYIQSDDSGNFNFTD